MATIVLPSALRLRQSSALPVEFSIEADRLGDAFDALVSAHPELREALFEAGGGFRSVVRVFVDEEPVDEAAGLDTPLGAKSEVFLLMPIAGG